MKEKKFNYVVPKVRVVQVKTRSSMLAGSLLESTSDAVEKGTGRFNARGSRFSSWEDFDEE